MQACTVTYSTFLAVLLVAELLSLDEVVSYLTPFTGLREGDLSETKALSLDRARRELQELLPRRLRNRGTERERERDRNIYYIYIDAE